MEGHHAVVKGRATAVEGAGAACLLEHTPSLNLVRHRWGVGGVEGVEIRLHLVREDVQAATMPIRILLCLSSAPVHVHVPVSRDICHVRLVEVGRCRLDVVCWTRKADAEWHLCPVNALELFCAAVM